MKETMLCECVSPSFLQSVFGHMVVQVLAVTATWAYFFERMKRDLTGVVEEVGQGIEFDFDNPMSKRCPEGFQCIGFDPSIQEKLFLDVVKNVTLTHSELAYVLGKRG